MATSRFSEEERPNGPSEVEPLAFRQLNKTFSDTALKQQWF
jgi:hypothetical protein